MAFRNRIGTRHPRQKYRNRRGERRNIIEDYVAAINRLNHTGRQSAETIADGTVTDAAFKRIADLTSNAQAQFAALATQMANLETTPGPAGPQGEIGDQGPAGADGDGGAAVAPAIATPAGASRLLGIPNVLFSSQNTLTRTQNRIYFAPFHVERSAVISAIVLEVTIQAAAATARAGIYSADDKLQPLSLLADSGDIDCSTLGIKSAIVPNVILPPGNYLLAFNSSNSATQFRLANGNTPSAGVSRTLGTAPFSQVWYTAAPVIGVPANPPAWNSVGYTNQQGMYYFALLDWSPQ